MNLSFKILDPDESDTAGWEKGFKIIRIEAFHGTLRVGFIKISLLTKENFQSSTSSVWHYLKNWRGLTKIDLDAFQASDLTSLFDSLCGYQSMPSYDAQSWTPEEKLKYLNRIEAKTLALIEEELKDLLDSPLIDYIEVSDNLRRRGIATSLYNQADEYMQSLGYKFRSSRLQSADAKATWERLVEKGLATRTSNGHYELI